MNAHRALASAVLVVALAAARATAAPIEFLVAEFPGHEAHRDSYVLVLQAPADIEHARALIAKGAAAGATIAVVRIAAGPDGRNRNVRAQGEPLWSWHQTSFEGFADATIELCDGWPGYVEQDVERWIANTNGTICFWSYTVAEELPEPGVALGIAVGAGALLVAARRRNSSLAIRLLETRRLTDQLPRPSAGREIEPEMSEPDYRPTPAHSTATSSQNPNRLATRAIDGRGAS